MKVLVVTATFPPMSSGGADYAFRLCQFLIKKGVEVHVVTGKAAVTTKSVGMEIYPVMASWSWLELIRHKTVNRDTGRAGKVMANAMPHPSPTAPSKIS